MKKTIILFFLLNYITNSLIAQIPNYVPQNGLVSWWSFTGNADDSSPNNNNGTVNGATLTTDRYGAPNSAYEFDGSSNSIQILNTLLYSPTSYSISYWVHPNSANGGVIFSDRHGTNCGYKYALNVSAVNGPSVGMHVTTPWTAYSVSAQDTIPVNGWTHVIGTYDFGIDTLELWINGISVGKTLSDIWNTESNPTTIGAYDGCGTPLTSFFFGKIDDIGVWNRVLNQNEVEGLYGNYSVFLDKTTSLNSENITVYPTIIDNELSFEIENISGKSSVRLIDIYGKVLIEKNLSLNGSKYKSNITLENLPPGYYIFSIIGEQVYSSQRVVKL